MTNTIQLCFDFRAKIFFTLGWKKARTTCRDAHINNDKKIYNLGNIYFIYFFNIGSKNIGTYIKNTYLPTYTYKYISKDRLKSVSEGGGNYLHFNRYLFVQFCI